MKMPWTPKFKVGDIVMSPYHEIRYTIGRRSWWFGWTYDLHTPAYGIVYLNMKEKYLRKVS